MRLNILIGGKAGQGINKVSEIVAKVLASYGYFSFNYRDYQSLIRGGHNFNVLCISDKWIASTDSVMDIIVALDDKTLELHKKELKKNGGVVIDAKGFEEFGRNINIALSGALIKILGIDKKILLDEIKEELNNESSLSAAENGYETQDNKFSLKKLNNKSIYLITGNSGIVRGAVNSGMGMYFAYPMTPATGVMHELATKEVENCNFIVVQPENEIAVINMGLGASYAGKKVMIGTSGGGFDLMTEALSLSGQAEIPIVIYLASRPGPSTGVPTYTSQADLDVAMRGGHGEFPRVVVAPGDANECTENTNEAFYLSEKFKIPVIVLSDKHLAEGEFAHTKIPNPTLKVEVKRDIPGKNKIVKASSYEHDKFGLSVETPELVKKGMEMRLKVYEDLKKECKKFDMIKIYGKKDSKNLIISWGSNKGAILDAIDGLDVKFLQVIYMKPMSDKIRDEIQKAKKVILVENSSTGQLGYLIREKTGLKIDKRILKYDGRPFYADELKMEIEKELKGK